MTLKEEIIQLVRRSPGLTDREITDNLKGRKSPQQPVNIGCRELEDHGWIMRARNRASDSFIGNYPVGTEAYRTETGRVKGKSPKGDAGEGHLSEDDIKKVLETWLEEQGWKTEIAWGKKQGIDIEASQVDKRWVIEVKGPGSRQPMRANYFLSILGELLQRMADDQAAYSIAFPDMKQYQRLWERLPTLAKKRTKITILLIDPRGKVTHLEQ